MFGSWSQRFPSMVNWPWCFRPTWQLNFLHKRARTLNPLLGHISSHLNMPHEASPHKVSSHSQSHKVGPTFSTHEPFNRRPKLQQDCSQKAEPLTVCSASQDGGFSSSASNALMRISIAFYLWNLRLKPHNWVKASKMPDFLFSLLLLYQPEKFTGVS